MSSIPPWIKSASNNWISNRTGLAAVLYQHATSKAMSFSELQRFVLIQKWLNNNAAQARDAFREELIKSGGSLGEKFALEEVDWSKPGRVLLYGSCIQGTAQKGGDADFALCFPAASSSSKNATGDNSSVQDDQQQQKQQQPQFIEPPRLLQRSVILPTFFKQLGEIFPQTNGLTSRPQPLHVDRVYHARVPILHFVPKHKILPQFNPKAAKSFVDEANGSDHSLPRFDVAACSSGCRNSFILRHYFSQSVYLRVLFLALKRWARHRAHVMHSKRSSLNSYSLAIMLIYWAQERATHLIDHAKQQDEDKSGQKKAMCCGAVDASWSFVETSPLVNAEKSFLSLSDEFYCGARRDEQHENDNEGKGEFDEQQKILACFLDFDNSKQPDQCISALLFDFFLFYSEIFDRDTQVVDIRASKQEGKVTSRAEWKEMVNAQFANRDLRVFGLETDDNGKPAVVFPPGINDSKVKQANADTNCGAFSHRYFHDDETREFDVVTRHLYGHDVIAVRDPVEPHSVTRNLDFFMCEALWEEFKLAVSNCHDPVQLLGSTI